MLQMCDNEISLYKWFGDTAQFRTLATGAGIASYVRVGYFSNVATRLWRKTSEFTLKKHQKKQKTQTYKM